MIQNTVDSLSAETFLAEVLRQDRSRHFFQISHVIHRYTAADDFFHIGICNI